MNKRPLSLAVFLLFATIFFTSCTKTETKTETVSIPYDSVKESDDTLWEGEEKTVQQGKEGEKEITYKLTYRNGGDNEPDREDIDEKVTTEDTDEIIKIGAKARSTSKVVQFGDITFEILNIKRTRLSSTSTKPQRDVIEISHRWTNNGTEKLVLMDQGLMQRQSELSFSPLPNYEIVPIMILAQTKVTKTRHDFYGMEGDNLSASEVEGKYDTLMQPRELMGGESKEYTDELDVSVTDESIRWEDIYNKEITNQPKQFNFYWFSEDEHREPSYMRTLDKRDNALYWPSINEPEIHPLTEFWIGPFYSD